MPVEPTSAVVPSLRARPSRFAALALALVSLTHLGAQLASSAELARATQTGLMPLLALALWLATGARTRLVRICLVALGFSWLGDTVPGLLGGDAAFLALVGLFLLAQAFYVVAFWPFRRESLAARPVALVPYAAVLLALVALCAPGADALLGPVIVYGVCIVTMAVLATGLGRIAGTGAAVFVVSDAMIALGEFTTWFAPPVPGFWVMLTYIAAQALLVTGIVDRLSRDH